MSRDISNHDDVIDSRDVIARIEELEGERDYYTETHEPTTAELGDPAFTPTTWEDANEDDAAELKALKALQDKSEGYCDWKDGVQLVRDDYFENHAREEAESLGLIQETASWPYTCIDWEEAASELQQDYTSVEFDGITYWVR